MKCSARSSYWFVGPRLISDQWYVRTCLLSTDFSAVVPVGGASWAASRLLSSVVAPGSRKLCCCSRWSTLETRQLIPHPGTAWKSWQNPIASEPSSCGNPHRFHSLSVLARWHRKAGGLTSLQCLVTATPSGCSLLASAVPTTARICLRGMRAVSHSTRTRVTCGTPLVIVPVLSNITTLIWRRCSSGFTLLRGRSDIISVN